MLIFLFCCSCFFCLCYLVFLPLFSFYANFVSTRCCRLKQRNWSVWPSDMKTMHEIQIYTKKNVWRYFACWHTVQMNIAIQCTSLWIFIYALLSFEKYSRSVTEIEVGLHCINNESRFHVSYAAHTINETEFTISYCNRKSRMHFNIHWLRLGESHESKTSPLFFLSKCKQRVFDVQWWCRIDFNAYFIYWKGCSSIWMNF